MSAFITVLAIITAFLLGLAIGTNAMRKLRCKLGWHRWYETTFNNKPHHRTCDYCGKREWCA